MGSAWARITERIADSHPEISVSFVWSESEIFFYTMNQPVLPLETKYHALGKHGEREYNSGAGRHASIQLSLTELWQTVEVEQYVPCVVWVEADSPVRVWSESSGTLRMSHQRMGIKQCSIEIRQQKSLCHRNLLTSGSVFLCLHPLGKSSQKT